MNKYLELINHFPLRPLRSNKDLEAANQLLTELLTRPLTPTEGDYLQVLSTLVEEYEAKEYPMEPVSDGDMLRFLIDQKGPIPDEVLELLDINLNDVLEDQVMLTRQQIRLLAQFFNVSPGVFNI